ncbi:Hypothetical predicted protein, partial [Marmota monax]
MGLLGTQAGPLASAPMKNFRPPTLAEITDAAPMQDTWQLPTHRISGGHSHVDPNLPTWGFPGHRHLGTLPQWRWSPMYSGLPAPGNLMQAL